MVHKDERRSITGCSSASSSYPIPENVEHRTQMGDLSVFQDKPIITINDNVNANTKFTDKLVIRKQVIQKGMNLQKFWTNREN